MRSTIPRSLAFLVVASCSSTTKEPGFFDSDAAAGVDAGRGPDGGFVGDDGSVGQLGGDGAVADGAADPGLTLLYAHDNVNLYKVDPNDPKLGTTLVGKFDCIGGPSGPSSMTDLAIDKDGKLYGVAPQTVFLDMKVNGATVACKAGARPLSGGDAGSRAKFYGASFVPPGALDPANETLTVGNTDGEIYKVDTATGALTLVGSFGNVPPNDGPPGHTYAAANVGKPWEMSGDIVFLANGGTPVGFATVRDCPNPPATTGCNPIDTLIEIDLTKLSATSPGVVTKAVRGQIVKSASCADTAHTGYGSMFGIAAYKSDIIGFSHDGFVVKIDNNKGAACLVADDSATLKFDGAGVTTRAPVVAPPPPN